jgi:hypothetical protein
VRLSAIKNVGNKYLATIACSNPIYKIAATEARLMVCAVWSVTSAQIESAKLFDEVGGLPRGKPLPLRPAGSDASRFALPLEPGIDPQWHGKFAPVNMPRLKELVDLEPATKCQRPS